MDNSLLYRQSALMAAINTGESAETFNAKGLEVYRRNLLFNAARTLRISYPVLTRLIGEESMGALAKQLLNQSPPNSGDWGDWGGQIDNLLSVSALDSDYPFLKNIATLEWLIHSSNRAFVQPVDVASLSLLEKCDLNTLGVTLSAGVFLLESNFGIDHIWLNHQSSGLDQGNTYQDISYQKNAASGKDIASPCQLLISQHQGSAGFQRLSSQEFAWFSALQRGASLDYVITHFPEFDLSNWLADAIEKNLIAHLSVCSTITLSEDLASPLDHSFITALPNPEISPTENN